MLRGLGKSTSFQSVVCSTAILAMFSTSNFNQNPLPIHDPDVPPPKIIQLDRR